MGDDLIQQYFEDLRDVATASLSSERDCWTYIQVLVDDHEPAICRMISARQHVISSRDRDVARPYLTTGFFTTLPDERRIAAILVVLDVGRESAALGTDRAFAPYSTDQPLFVRHPLLLSAARKNELLPDFREFALRQDGIISYRGTYLRLSPYLDAHVVAWAREAFSAAPRYIRLDPTFLTLEQQPSTLAEATLHQADPSWWRTLSIKPGGKTGSAVSLDEPSNPTSDLQAYLDYSLHGVRRIEMHARRRKSDYLSMMVEELSVKDDGQVLVGRCVHLDTAAAAGTPVAAARVNHVDLAVNIYRGSAATARIAQSLADGAGRVEDASMRVHLLRLENVPPTALFPLARLFFTSDRLFSEWISDFFGSA